jgi:hypothetical protein
MVSPEFEAIVLNQQGTVSVAPSLTEYAILVAFIAVVIWFYTWKQKRSFAVVDRRQHT